MDSIDDLMGQIPLDQLADKLGVDRATAEQATRKALPALLAGLQANAQDPAGEASLAQALGKHSKPLFGSGVDLSQIDTDDGDAIVGHVFGANREQVVNKLGSTGAADQGLIGKLLPMLAPMVLSWLAGKFMGGNKAGTRGGWPVLIGRRPLRPSPRCRRPGRWRRPRRPARFGPRRRQDRWPRSRGRIDHRHPRRLARRRPSLGA